MSLDPQSAKLAMQGDFPMLRTPQFALCAMSELLQTKVECRSVRIVLMVLQLLLWANSFADHMTSTLEK